MKAIGARQYHAYSIILFIVPFMLLPKFGSAQSKDVPPASRPVILKGKVADRLALDQPKPDYPVFASANYIQGRVKIELFVGCDGKVAHAHVVEGNPILAAAGLAAVRRWHYRPLETPSGPSGFITVVDLNFAYPFDASDPRPRQPEKDLDQKIKPPTVIGGQEDSSPTDFVRLRLLINENGQVMDSSPLPNTRGDLRAAEEIAQSWTYRPAHWGNMPVSSYLEINVPIDNAPRLATRQAIQETPK